MTATRLGLLATVSILATAPLLEAQGNSARVRQLNQEVVRFYGLLQRATASQAAALGAQAAPIIEERFNALNALIEENPSEALSVAFSADLLADLARAFSQSASKLESHGIWQGITHCSVSSDPTMTKMVWRHNLKTAEGGLDVFFSGVEPNGLRSGHVVTVNGVRAGKRVAAANGSIQGDTAAATCSTLGAQNVVVVLANFQSYTLPASMNADFVKGALLGNAYTSAANQSAIDWSVDDFWQQNSDGQTWINKTPGSPGELTVVGPVTLPGNYNASSTCDDNGIRNDAIAAADPYVNFQNYSRLLIVFPPNGACTFAGLGSLGCWTNTAPQDGNFTASVAWQRSDQMSTRSNAVKLTTHEKGHNLSLHHASSRDFGIDAIGPLNTQGTLSEYGDLTSTMGSWNLGLYSAQHQVNQLGWMDGTNYQVVDTPGGEFTIQAYETRPAGVKALKIRRGTGNNMWAWLEYRTNTGRYSSQLNSQVWSGALIHYYDSFTGTHTHLVDFTPATSSFADPALAVGQTWTDPYSDVKIYVKSSTATTLTVVVDYIVAPCTQANPFVTVTPANPSVVAGTQFTYNISVRNDDAGGCANATFNLGQSTPIGWNPILSPATLTLAPGATGSATLKVTPPAAGFYSPAVTASATNASAALYTHSSSANCTVTTLPPAPVVALGPLNPTYPKRSTVPLSATVTVNGSPVAGAPVTFYLTRPGGSVTTKTATTGSTGTATWNYKANTSGGYSVYATGTANGQTSSSAAKTFTVL